jgi:hypothetical protein
MKENVVELSARFTLEKILTKQNPKKANERRRVCVVPIAVDQLTCFGRHLVWCVKVACHQCVCVCVSKKEEKGCLDDAIEILVIHVFFR